MLTEHETQYAPKYLFVLSPMKQAAGSSVLSL